MGSIIVAKDQLKHFSHVHLLSLVHLQQQNHKNKNSDDEDENEEQDGVVEEVHHGGQCGLCEEHIWSFHQCYYYCKSCDYSLHTFCADLTRTLQNNTLHPDHNLQFYDATDDDYDDDDIKIKCYVCNRKWENKYAYCCDVCGLFMHIICATISEQKLNHPSHPHQLERMFMDIVSRCVACGNKHEGVFFQCTSCPMFRINLDCALLPTKLLIQISTNGNFTHSHPLTLTYSFLYPEYQDKFYPRCRVCGGRFHFHLWKYKCDKCRYYVHVDCATSKREPFMSIFLPASVGKITKNYRDDEHPSLLHCPFQDEGDNLLKRHISNQKGKKHDDERLNLYCHQQPIILYDKHTLVGKNLVSLHDPMKRVQLLCDGCVKPIVTVPFYMCCKYVDEQCCSVLHEWCANLPSQIQNYFGHSEHPLFLLPQFPKFFRVFKCDVCNLPSNGFAYGCMECEYQVDINCAFIPKEITHEAHPDHILLIVKPSTEVRCKACRCLTEENWGFQCPSCEFYIHVKCALLLPRVIKNKLDKHPLSLRYEPVESHIGKYFCEICEDEFNPWGWFYHCTTCAQSMHTKCAPLILQCEQASSEDDDRSVYKFLNVKFRDTLEIKDHPHPLSFVQRVESDGYCSNCRRNAEYLQRLKHEMIFKCQECKFALHFECALYLTI